MTDQIRTLLTRLDEASVGAPPLSELLREGRAARRRRRGAAVLAGALAVALVAAAGVWALGGGGPDHASDRGLAVTAPPGTTYVGVGRAVVAVPDDWTLSTASCTGSATDVFYYPQPTDGVCGSTGANTSTVAITTQQPSWDRQSLPKASPVGGYDVVDSGPECLDSLPPQCSEVVGLPSLDAYFTIDSSTVDAETVIATIRRSLTVLPEGQVALPNVVGETEGQADQELARLGLHAETPAVPCPSCTHVVSSDPPGGAIVPGGSSVVLHLGSPPAAPAASGQPQLDGTWKVEGLIGPDGHSLLDDSERGRVTLTFDHGKVSGSTGCNQISGTYRQDGPDLRFDRGALGSTLALCTNEPPVVQRLLAVRHVSTASGHLHLHAANWMIVVDLVRG